MIIGGSYNCRTCGGYHNSSKICHKMPRQKAQISIERLHASIGMISLAITDRELVNQNINNLRQYLDIPKDKIYNRANVTEEILNTTNAFQDLKYNPTPEQITKAKTVVDQINNLIEKKGTMTADDQELFKFAIKGVK